jgi:hypothetical protein
MAAVAYWILQRTIMAAQGPDSLLATAVGADLKGKLSPLLYITGIVLAFVDARLGGAMYFFVALMWLVPDRRIERALGRSETDAARRRGNA